MVFAYLGEGEPPLLTHYEFMDYPLDHIEIRKYYQECNYLQANEGNFDPAHNGILHRQFVEAERAQAQSHGFFAHERVKGADLSVNTLYNMDAAPRIETERTSYGVRLYSIRSVEGGRQYIKILNFVFPNLCAVPGGAAADGYNLNWHVPIDDYSHWKYMISFRRSAPFDQEAFRREYAATTTPDHHLLRNRSNRYGQDREEMCTSRFAGMGPHFPVHDAFATETPGPIQDRSAEHLGYSDRGIVAMRLAMLRALADVQEGRDPPHVIRDPASNSFPDLVPPSAVLAAQEDYHEYWTRGPAEAAGTQTRHSLPA